MHKQKLEIVPSSPQGGGSQTEFHDILEMVANSDQRQQVPIVILPVKFYLVLKWT